VTMQYKRVAISVFAISLMLLGMTLLPVSAAYIPTQTETFDQSFVAEENGHTYMYVDNEIFIEQLEVSHNEDMNVEKYFFQESSWSNPFSVYPGPAERRYYFSQGSGIYEGWLADGTFLPSFHDFVNKSSAPLEIGAFSKRNVFPAEIGVQSSIIIESNALNFGTFNLTDEEFIHVTFGGRSDSADIGMLILDPQGRILTEGYVVGGNIEIVPFNPTGPGMYQMILISYTVSDNLCIADFSIDPVTPIGLPFGGIVDGVLPGSEHIIQDDGAMIQQEKVPTAITYKFGTNWTTPARLQFALNTPEITEDIYYRYEPWIAITAGVFLSEGLPYGYARYLTESSDPFYYQSFQNETYYATVIGMENVGYTLYHDQPAIDELPINQEFYVENVGGTNDLEVFSLQLSQDSVMRVNSTEGTYGYDWELWTVDDNMMYRWLEVEDNDAFEDAEIYYIPAGEYLLSAECSDSDAWGFFEFNVGPVIDGLGAVAVDNGGLIGVRFDTSVLSLYNLTIALNTHDNITAETDIDVLNTYGGYVTDIEIGLGNRQSGVGWVEYPSNFTSEIIENFCDGFGIAVISLYDVRNNTAGLPGNALGEYTVDYTVGLEDGAPWRYNSTASISIETGWYNFTLGDPGDAYEYHLLTVDCTEGTWMNVSVYVEDVSDWSCSIYQAVNGTFQRLSWGSLDNNFVGSYSGESAFQVGSISDILYFVFNIERIQAGEGRLDIEINQFLTNSFEFMPSVMYQGTEEPGLDMGMVPLAAGAGIAIVAVIIVILKKKPGLLGRS